MFNYLKQRALKKETMRLGNIVVAEMNEALDGWFAKVEEVSKEFLKILDEDLTTIGDEPNPRAASEACLIDIVEEWRAVRPELEARGREHLAEAFGAAETIGALGRMEEVYTEKFNEAEFNFTARGVIAAGEAATAAEARREP